MKIIRLIYHVKRVINEYIVFIFLYLHVVITLTLILPIPKVISICHQYRARPACTSCSLSRLYTVGWPSSSFHCDIPKTDKDIKIKTWSWLAISLEPGQTALSCRLACRAVYCQAGAIRSEPRFRPDNSWIKPRII